MNNFQNIFYIFILLIFMKVLYALRWVFFVCFFSNPNPYQAYTFWSLSHHHKVRYLNLFSDKFGVKILQNPNFV